jgi:hypothetical protein
LLAEAFEVSGRFTNIYQSVPEIHHKALPFADLKIQRMQVTQKVSQQNKIFVELETYLL